MISAERQKCVKKTEHCFAWFPSRRRHVDAVPPTTAPLPPKKNAPRANPRPRIWMHPNSPKNATQL
jgi:hypothetical protein